MACKINLLIREKSDALAEMTAQFRQAQFFKQELRILLNTLIGFLTQELHRGRLETNLVTLLQQFVGISSQDNAEDDFAEYVHQFVSHELESPFGEEVFVRLEQVEELESFEEFLNHLKATVKEIEIKSQKAADNSKKTNQAKSGKKKKIESSVFQDSEQSGFARELEHALVAQMRRRVAHLFDLFAEEGRRITKLRDHQVHTAERIGEGFLAAEKETVAMLTSFLGELRERE